MAESPGWPAVAVVGDVEQDWRVAADDVEQQVVSYSAEIAAPVSVVFELIADPAEQPRWDGNDNLAGAAAGQRVRAVGGTFTTMLTLGSERVNHIVEFEEGRRIAWRPSEVGGEPPGHLWRWEVEPIDDTRTRVTHTYDWTDLTDPGRFGRARSTGTDRLSASVERLRRLAESIVAG